MTTNRVYVKMRETYDLSTKENSLGVIGIHTPRGSPLSLQYDGLFKNFKFMRFLKCDVKIACASLMPLDPLQVGLEAGEVNPQDIFNPILYTAVSNDYFGRIQSLIYSMSYNEAKGPSAEWDDDVVANYNANTDNPQVSALDVYYGLLATDQFSTAMPQQGLAMRGLVPMCHKVAFDKGVSGRATFSDAGLNVTIANPIERGNGYEEVGMYTTGITPMPRIPTMVARSGSPQASQQTPTNIYQNNVSYNPVYCGMIIMPPAVLQKLYFRMTVTWTIEFSEFRPLPDMRGFELWAQLGQQTHISDYGTQSATMTTTAAMVDVQDMGLEPIMTTTV